LLDIKSEAQHVVRALMLDCEIKTMKLCTFYPLNKRKICMEIIYNPSAKFLKLVLDNWHISMFQVRKTRKQDTNIDSM